jgi:L-ribulose-5-phosphate 3-epimerase
MAFKIGVMIDSFRKSTDEGLVLAKSVGAEGFQVYVVGGDMAPEALDAAGRKRFRSRCAELKLDVAALCGDLGGHGFERADENTAKVARSKKIVDLAVDLGSSVVTTHIGVIPDDPASTTYKAMQDACRELGRYAAAKGVTFAIETGPETALLLRAFLDSLGVKGIGVNLDPANLVMVTGDDPVKAVHTLAPYIVHTHAKDGRQLQPCDRREVYGSFADGGFDKLVERMGKLFEETPLGEGAVDWPRYLAALSKIGYKGFLTIEREVGANPEADIRKAVTFLKGMKEGA